jgi:hypothetical protein
VTSAAKAELKNQSIHRSGEPLRHPEDSRLVLWPAKPTLQPGDGFQGIAFQVSLQ